MISIIIPIFNQHEMSQECIQSVMEHTEQPYEIVIIDNGSDPPFESPFTGFNELRLVRNETNQGFPVAVNQGIAVSKGETIVLLNNDVIVTPGAINRLAAWLENVDIVAPTSNYCAGLQRVDVDTYNTREQLDEVAEEIADALEGEGIEVNWVIGFCMAFKRSLYNDLGKFDESLWPCSGEEIDFCLRARKRGYKIGIAMDTYMHHEGSLTFKDLERDGVADYEKICERNDRHLANRWGNDFWFNQLAKNELRLNLGCGEYPISGFTNIDQAESVNPDVVANALDLPYESGSADEIYCGHLLEHLFPEDAKKALAHWFDLLKPGGTISISVPDFDYLVAQHLAKPTFESMIELNDLYIYSYVQESHHRCCYNEALLRSVMESAGFTNLKKMPKNHPYFVDAVDWQIGFTGGKP